MSNAPSYRDHLPRLEEYFDRTAAAAWERLTSDAPVSGVRATVRAGRERMRQTILSWLDDDLTGQRLLDAGCGTGSLSLDAAARGADVLGIDLSPSLIGVAEQRAGSGCPQAHARTRFAVGDCFDPDHGGFDNVVLMDVLIHYEAGDLQAVLADLTSRTRERIIFTVAPRTPLLATMHATGKLFPRADRSPAIKPIAQRRLERLLSDGEGFAGWQMGRVARVSSGFYISQAVELRRAG